MKRIFFCAAVVFSLLTTSCFDVIFPRIRDEVALEKATKNGAINSIVRYGGEIWFSNGSVWHKSETNQSYDAWKEDTSAPKLSYDRYTDTFDGAQIIKLAASNDALFALAVTFTTDQGESRPDKKIIYKKDGSGWSNIKQYDISGSYSSSNAYTGNDGITIFCTNSPQQTNRKAFVRANGAVYELNGSGVGNADVSSSGNNYEKLGNANGSNINSAVSCSGKTYFFSGLASGSDETNANSSGTYIYWTEDNGSVSYGSTLYYKNVSSGGAGSGNTNADGSVSASKGIYSLAVNSDSIVLGTYQNGIMRVPLDGNKKPSGNAIEIVDVDGAGALTVPFIITAMLSQDPSKTEKQNIMYAAMNMRGSESATGASASDVGLWSYYPSRANWNRE